MGGKSRHISAKRRPLNSILRLKLELGRWVRRKDTLTEGTGLHDTAHVSPTPPGIRSNRKTGSQPVSPVEGSPVLMCDKETSRVGRRE